MNNWCAVLNDNNVILDKCVCVIDKIINISVCGIERYNFGKTVQN